MEVNLPSSWFFPAISHTDAKLAPFKVIILHFTNVVKSSFRCSRGKIRMLLIVEATKVSNCHS